MYRLVDPRRLPMSARGLSLASTITMMMMLTLGAPSAMATPGGEFAVFAQCPFATPELNACVAIRAESGEITVGKLKVPIIKPQTLQGGLLENKETHALIFVGAANGETMPRTPQAVPGGSVQCEEVQDGRWSDRRHRRRFDRRARWWFERAEHRLCEAIFENKRAGLYATPELAAPASSIGLNIGAALSGQGTALSLPVKFKLENPLLGNKCYIGSDANPIVIDFTDGTAGPLTGKVGELHFSEEGILAINDVTFVSNTFTAPEATSCGYNGLLDSLINKKLGLPAPAGTNTAIFNGTHEQAGREVVEEHNEPTTTTTPPPSRHHRR